MMRSGMISSTWVFAGFAALLGSQDGDTDAAPVTPPVGPQAIAALVEEVKLENGWTFLLVPRPAAPIVSFETYVNVGSIHEQIGRSGLAHMLEHMAFKGSDRVGSLDWEAERDALEQVEERYRDVLAARSRNDEPALKAAEAALHVARTTAAKFVDVEAFSRLLEDAGGVDSLNASTTAEDTRYVVSLPANQIELWCWLEAERFKRPVLREFYSERDAVMEERRMRVESNPFGLLLEQLQLNAFQTHPYRNPVVGYAVDIANFSRTEADYFFLEHYGARNLVTAIVGDIDTETLKPLLKRYFSSTPPGPASRPAFGTETEQKGERRVNVSFPAQPLLAIAWHVPALEHPDYAAVDITLRLMGRSRSSRLVRRLVRQDGNATAIEVFGGWPGNRFTNLAVVLAVPTAGAETTALESAVYEELTRLRLEGPSAAELESVQRVARAELLRGLRTNEEIASLLTEYQSKTGDWRKGFTQIQALDAVTPEDVKRVLGAYFRPSNRTVTTLVSPNDAEEGK
jgi:predicted Zn-dependent peptidase